LEVTEASTTVSILKAADGPKKRDARVKFEEAKNESDPFFDENAGVESKEKVE
jgi:hypothetical protein